MGDFAQKTVVKSAVRTLTNPIADYTTFHALIQDILDNNPWGCTSYISAGVTKPGVEISKEAYAASISYVRITKQNSWVRFRSGDRRWLQ